MKKFLGSIFTRTHSTESVRAASKPAASDDVVSNIPNSKYSEGFLLPSLTHSEPIPADLKTMKSVDAVLRGVATHVKAFIANILNAEEHGQCLKDIRDFVNEAVAKYLQQSDELSLNVLMQFFSCPLGLALCEQTAFPSLALDFAEKMQVLAVKEELGSMVRQSQDRSQDKHARSAFNSATLPSVEWGFFKEMISSLELLMKCVVAIASNEKLMEEFRCEVPNLIALTAEEYPSMAIFIRDYCSRALMAVPERNFNAGLTWYLLDCDVIAKTVERMDLYTLATPTTLDTAERALQNFMHLTSDRYHQASSLTGIDDLAAAAAVSEALGLTRNSSNASDRDREDANSPMSPLNLPIDDDYHSSSERDSSTLPEMFCLPSYDVRSGLGTLVYVLEKTYRFSTVLLEAFQGAGGYKLLLRLLDTCSEEQIPALLNVLTLLMPLGSRTSGSSDGESVLLSLEARNVYAFSTMRDLLLKYITDIPLKAEPALDSNTMTHRRNEHLILQLLTQILQTYTSDYDNFVFLEPKTRTLALLLTKLPCTTFYDAQVMILRIVEYVCCAAQPDDPLSHNILSVVCGLLIAYDPIGKITNSENAKGMSEGQISSAATLETMLLAFGVGTMPTLSNLMCELLIKVLRNSEMDSYKQEISAFGLMDRGIYVWLDQIATCLIAIPETDTLIKQRALAVLKPQLDVYGNLLCLMLRHNMQESARFRQSLAHQSLYVITEVIVSCDAVVTPFDIVKEDRSHLEVFSVMSSFTELAMILQDTSSHERASQLPLLQSGVELDIGAILGLLKRFHGFAWRQQALLYVLMDILKAGGPAAAAPWRRCQGYENLIALFLSENMLANSESKDSVFQMMDVVLELFNMSLDQRLGQNDNVEYFKSINGYVTITSCIVISGYMQTSKRELILQRVFDLIASGTVHIEILNGDAVYIFFQLLINLPERIAIDTMLKLYAMLECKSDASLISRKERAIRLVRAGVFDWMNNSNIIDKIKDAKDPLNRHLLNWITAIVLEEDLSIPQSHHVLRLVGRVMPKLLNNDCISSSKEETLDNVIVETGLLLLQRLLKIPVVRHISVGKPQGSGQTGQYVHIVNSTNRTWPPSSGYSFSCWLRFPASGAHDFAKSSALRTKATTPLHPLCEGDLCFVPEGNHEERRNVYGVLEGAILKLFASKDRATDHDTSIGEFDVTNVARTGPLEWSFVSDARTFRASCADSAMMKRWWHALEQCHNFNKIIDQSVLNGDVNLNNAVLSAFGVASSADITIHRDTLSEAEEGSACIVSIYSLETSGSYTRAFFEHSTGLLCFHTGAVNSGPSMNSSINRTSVVFDEIAIDDLRPARSTNKISTENSQAEVTNRIQDWHHFAFTHRKSVMGSSLVTVYIDGREIATKKLNFPAAPSVGSFQAFIGSDAQVCSPHSALSWKIGPTWLTDELFTSRMVAGMFSLGPAFAHHFSGHSYRAVGDWQEARASFHLAQAADRGIELATLAQRLNLIRLGRACRRQCRDWNDLTAIAANMTPVTANDAVAAGAALLAESMIAKKEELTEGLRLAAGGSGGPFRKERIKVPAFRILISDECAMSAFGAEFESLLQTCNLSEDTVLFTVNTSSCDRSSSPILSHTQVHYVDCTPFNGFDLARSLPSLGGLGQVIFPLLDHATRRCDFYLVLKMLVKVLRRNACCLAECIESNGYNLIAALLCTRANLVDEKVLTCTVRLAVAGTLMPYATTNTSEMTKPPKLAHPVIVDSMALARILLNMELRKKLPHHLQCQLMSLLMDLLVIANPNALFNARQLRRANFFQWLLTYLTELGNEPCEMDQAAGLEMRWCFPKFLEPSLEAILQYTLSLLRAFIRMESHVDDLVDIGEMLLLSMTNGDLHARESPIRIILLQFLLHEIENDAAHIANSGDLGAKPNVSLQRLSDTIVEAILYRGANDPQAKKREESHFDNGNNLEATSLKSPQAESSSIPGIDFSMAYPVNGLANVFLDVIGQGQEEGPWAATEALLSLRILFSLAQSHPAFAEHLLCQTHLMHKLKRVLRNYNTNCCMFIPLLAYVFDIPIGDVGYSDPVTLSATELGLKQSTPDADMLADNVWELIGDLLHLNCRMVSNSVATEVTVIVLEILVGQVKTSSAFFAAVCKSSGTLFRILAQCMFICTDASPTTSNLKSSHSLYSAMQENSSSTSPSALCNTLEKLVEFMGVEKSVSTSIIGSCVSFTQVIMTRALSGNEFGALMLLFLEALDESASKQNNLFRTRVAGQKCWLALLKYVLERQKVLSANTSLLFMRNLCTVCVALARYLADEQNHNVEVSNSQDFSSNGQELGANTFRVFETDSQGIEDTALTCFGVDAVMFLLSCCDLCSLPAIAEVLGEKQFQLFYGVLIYCLQTVMLIELNHAHGKNLSISSQLLTCMIESKHIFLQQPKWQGLVCCGIKAQSTSSDASSGLEPYHASSGRSPHFMHRVRSLSANAHKEFGIGVESDRCFISALSFQLYRMLMDDSARVRHFAILMWQYMIDQRFDVLKEFLIVEPRTSVLQTITSTKKDATIDLFHGGFDRLLYALHIPDDVRQSDQASSSNLLLNQEIWSQFQHWIAESTTYLDDLIVVKSKAIYRHSLDVLLSCISVRSLSAGIDGTELSLDINFPLRPGPKFDETRSNFNDSLEFDQCEIVAKNTALKYTSIRDSALESMNDGVFQWRELSLRLANTRNIWQTGRWQVGAAFLDFATELEPQRRIFQRKSLGYKLDPTEGPKRMRLRLARDYTYEGRMSATHIDADKCPSEKDKITYADELLWPLSCPPLDKADTSIRRSLEFHDAVEVFREAVAAKSANGNVHSFREILTRCRLDSTRQLFDDLQDSDFDSKIVSILFIARRLYSFYLEDTDSKPKLGVSSSIIRDIDHVIENSAKDLIDQSIPPTLFDAADVEATQFALYAVRHESFRAVPVDPIGRDGSDDEQGFEGSESDDSDGLEINEQTISGEHTPPQCRATQLVDVPAKDLVDGDALEPTFSKLNQKKRVDTSSDALYGAISRFLKKEDFPPMRSFKAAYVLGLERSPGLFVICRLGVYFIGGFTKLYDNLNASNERHKVSTEMVPHCSDESSSSGNNAIISLSEIKRKTTKRLIRAALTDLGMQFAPSTKGGDQDFTVVPLPNASVHMNDPLAGTATSSRWHIKYSNVKQICRIKYQLRPVGIELFDTFGSTYFLQLETSADREEVVKLLFQMPLVNSIFWSPVLRTGALVPSTKRMRQAVTKRWLRGSMTNFEYLMHLNTLAGRSFNDITQYPVFPWVIADYTSEFLDLDAYETYRDLSKPMGAISPNRAAQFCERFAAMSQEMNTDSSMETPAFHYGTHYSCSAYVINYLIRLEPFTAMALELQGGNFDHPDRLFRSIPSSWISASRDNLQDVRELIPEFFYLPEFLYNANNCKFGTTQGGEDVWHVILPPWAHNDPREFVRLNRRALESKYVSEHLHDWIDLVFGVKQTGQAAVDAQNVFMHFTYEGTVDIEQITDPIMRAATLAQIENFGQTPSRLFPSPHPQRKVPVLVPTSSSGGATIEAATTLMNPSAGHQYDGMPLSTIEAYVKWHTPLAPALVAIGKEYVFMKKHSAVSVSVSGVAVGDVKFVHDKMQCLSVGCCFMPPRCAKYLEWDCQSSVIKLRVYQPSPGTGRHREASKVLAVIEGAHHDGINCASVSEDGALLVTGGQDAVVNLMECSKFSDGRRVFKQVAKYVGHSDAVTCVAINKEFNLIASSSADRSVLLWDLRTRALLQELAGHAATVCHVSINSANGNIMTATSSEIRLWSINGDLLAASSSSAFGLQNISCAMSTRCDSWQSGVIAVTGHANGAIAFWGIRYPTDLAQPEEKNRKAETATAENTQSTYAQEHFCSSPISSKRVNPVSLPVSITHRSNGSSAQAQVVPSCQLFVLKLLLDHRSMVTALTLGPEQRQLFSGDAEGNCIRWVDDSVSPNIH